MNKRSILLLLAFLIVFSWVLIRRHGNTEQDRSSPTKVGITETNFRAFGNGVGRSNVQSGATQQVIQPIISFEQKLRDPNDEWRTPINFYGRVVDEKEMPVPDAIVEFGWNNLSGSPSKIGRSDADGLFSLEGEQGKYLQVRVQKEGYYSSKTDPHGFFYAGRNENFIGNPLNPVVFHLWRKGKAEPLVMIDKTFRVARDGTPLEVDLLNGKLVQIGQGHLRVECWTDDQGKKRGEKYDWKCRVTVPGGGMLDSTNEFAFLAPENGFQESFEIIMPASLGREWKKDVERQLFFKLKNGMYGRMRFAMIAAGDHFCMVGAATNPSGSRNLEFDPAVQPKQTVFE